MITKAIKHTCMNKFNAWVDSIENEQLAKKVRKHAYITGGAICSMLLDEKVNDFDIYFDDLDTATDVAVYYINKLDPTLEISASGYEKVEDPDVEVEGIMSMDEDRCSQVKITIPSSGVLEPTQIKGEKPEDEQRFYPRFISSNAITLSDKIQLIIRFVGDPEIVHTYFDYVHCTCYWQAGRYRTGKLVTKTDALVSILTKNLVYVGSLYPLAALIRIKKFVKRGWTISAGQMLKVIWQTNKLDLSNVSVLADQLTGVDLSYFSMLISILGKKVESDPDFAVDYSYVCELLERLDGGKLEETEAEEA
jgi:hypothetical protein